jgi:phospholipid/cholesterol/gamma-HCH transport system permease protein
VTPQTPWVRLERNGGAAALVAGGLWTLAHLETLDRALRATTPDRGETVALDFAAIDALDTAAAFIVARWIARQHEQGVAIDESALAPAQAGLIRRVRLAERAKLGRPSRSPLLALLERTGRATFAVIDAARHLLGFFGLVTIVMLRTLVMPKRLRLVALVSHVERIGLHALPIVGLLSFLIGVVLAYQGADQLRAYGAEIFTVNLLGVSILRELGVLLTAIMVAGRSGSAFTAEIGTMKVNEEVDAMLTLGLDPVEVLVLPRLFGMIIALPLLTLFATLMSLAGGAVMTVLALDISVPQFLTQLREAVTATTFWVGMIKAPVFAFIIALVGCYEGLRVTGSAESVGIQTTKSVVESIFLVIVADAAFSILFSIIGV